MSLCLRTCILCIVSVFSTGLQVLAQAAPCRLLDAVSNEPVAYANLYVPALGTGVVSDATGELRLTPKLANADPATPATISCIGYVDRSLTLGELRATDQSCALSLEPQAYPLAQAEVSEVGYSDKTRQLGFRKDESNMMSGFTLDNDVVGTELGNAMHVKGPWLLQRIGTNMRVDTATLFELNVYEYDKGQPGKRLHDQRMLMAVPISNSRVLELDMRPYAIHGEGSFLVTLEVLGAAAPVDTLTFGGPERFASLADGVGDSIAVELPLFNSRIAMLKKRRITRCRKPDGTWDRAPIGLVIGLWADVKGAR